MLGWGDWWFADWVGSCLGFPASAGIPLSGVGHLGFACSRPLTLREGGGRVTDPPLSSRDPPLSFGHFPRERGKPYHPSTLGFPLSRE